MGDVRKSDFGLAGQIEPRVAIANSLRMLHTEKLAFLPNPWRFLLEAPSAVCCLKNCDRGKKSSFSTVSTQSKSPTYGRCAP